MEYCVQQSFPVVGRYTAENENTSPYSSDPAAAPMQRSHAADDHDDERVQQPLAVLARRDVALRGATTPPNAASAEPTRNASAKTNWMLRPSAEVICRSSTPARITIPVRVRWSQSQSTMPRHEPRESTTSRASE